MSYLNSLIERYYFSPPAPLANPECHIALEGHPQAAIPWTCFVRGSRLTARFSIKVFWCLDADTDLERSAPYLKNFVDIFYDALLKRLPEMPFELALFVWDYPGYGHSAFKHTPLELLLSQAELFWDRRILRDALPAYRILIGSGIGCAPASWVFERCRGVDRLFLLNPFAGLLRSTRMPRLVRKGLELAGLDENTDVFNTIPLLQGGTNTIGVYIPGDDERFSAGRVREAFGMLEERVSIQFLQTASPSHLTSPTFFEQITPPLALEVLHYFVLPCMTLSLSEETEPVYTLKRRESASPVSQASDRTLLDEEEEKSGEGVD